MSHPTWIRVIACGAGALFAAASGRAMTSAELSQAVRSAAGNWDDVVGIVQDGTVLDSGMRGTWQAAIDCAGQKWEDSADFGRVRAAEGIVGSRHWRQDFSGGSHRLDSEFSRQSTATDLWVATRGYLKPGFGRADVGPVEERSDGGRAFLVVDATPPGGQSVELWFAADTRLLARTVRQMNISTDTVTFADYRLEANRQVPGTITEASSESDQKRIVHVAHVQFVDSIDPNKFSQPAPPADWAMTGESASVPIEFEGEVAVEATINGKGPFTFILDTGGHDILTPATVATLGVETFGETASGGAGAGTVEQKYARVQTVALGNLVLKDQPFAVIDMPYIAVERGKRPPFAGILGLELFERFAVKLDYTNRHLIFTTFSKFHPLGAGVRAPIRFNDDMPLVGAKLNGITGDFAIDTGNGGTLVVQHVWAERHQLANSLKQGVALVSYGMGGESRNWASRAQSFELAGTVLPRAIIRYAEDKAGSFSSRTEAGNIGNTILPYFTVTFDYASGDAWFERAGKFEPPPFGRAGLAMAKVAPDFCLVVVVIPGSPAARAGLRQGDHVVQVGGEAVAALSGFELRERFTAAAGSAVPVTVLRDGRPVSVSINLKDLLP